MNTHARKSRALIVAAVQEGNLSSLTAVAHYQLITIIIPDWGSAINNTRMILALKTTV